MRAFVLWLGLGLVGAPLAAQAPAACPSPSQVAHGLKQPRAAVRYLADDALEGRLAGSAGERCAGDYLAREFHRLGLAPAGDSGSYFQSLSLASIVNPHAPPGMGRNVVGILRGKSDPTIAVVVGAHYDHLGRGPFGSLAPDDVGVVHHGADDNASGVAALLEVAQRVKKHRPAASVVFVAFTGEEEGLLGSRYFAAHPPMPLADTRAMVNMDMVGRLGSQPLLVFGTGTADEWEGILKAADVDSLQLKETPDGYGASDHTSFYEKDVPVLHFFTNVHGDYHKPSDTWDKIDYPGIDEVAAMVARVVDAVANRPSALTLRRGVGTPPGQGGPGTPGYGAYLGTVPDFTPVDRGVRISSVRAGSPAEKAGIRAGDIIVGFDDHEVADLQGMTNELRARQAGDSVRITVLRGGERVTVTAVLGKR